MRRFCRTLAALLALFLLAGGGARAGYVGGEANRFTDITTPAAGTLRLPVFMVSFRDVRFAPLSLSRGRLQSLLFERENPESLAAYAYAASYGRLALEGEVYSYTAREDRADYESEEEGFEKLAMEVLTAFDDEIDYAALDGDGNGAIDAFALTIANPSLGGLFGESEAGFWWGCQATWWIHGDFRVDGVRPGRYIINDAQPSLLERDYFVEELAHELGHCMGLTDYYVPDADYDADGLNGVAGVEMMDEMTGDYCQFSKLMLGWLRDDQVQVYGGQPREFLLPSAQREGGCLIIPREADKSGFTREYFLVEYNTAEGNMADVLSRRDEGVRVFHVDARTEINYWGERAFRNENGSLRYGDGSRWRVLRLVNDGRGYFKPGARVNADTPGFGWYDLLGREAVDPGVEVRFAGYAGGCARIVVTPVDPERLDSKD